MRKLVFLQVLVRLVKISLHKKFENDSRKLIILRKQTTKISGFTEFGCESNVKNEGKHLTVRQNRTNFILEIKYGFCFKNKIGLLQSGANNT